MPVDVDLLISDLKVELSIASTAFANPLALEFSSVFRIELVTFLEPPDAKSLKTLIEPRRKFPEVLIGHCRIEDILASVPYADKDVLNPSVCHHQSGCGHHRDAPALPTVSTPFFALNPILLIGCDCKPLSVVVR